MTRRTKDIRFKVTEEEYQIIHRNMDEGGYGNISAYVRSRCLYDRWEGFNMVQQCHVREELEEIRKIAEKTTEYNRIKGHLDNINKIMGE